MLIEAMGSIAHAHEAKEQSQMCFFLFLNIILISIIFMFQMCPIMKCAHGHKDIYCGLLSRRLYKFDQNEKKIISVIWGKLTDK